VRDIGILYGVRESADGTWDVIVAGRTVDFAQSNYAARQKLRHLRDQAVRDSPLRPSGPGDGH
jgi:hypothetical protein